MNASGESYTYDWFSQNIPYWTEILSSLRGKPHLHFLEIGSFEGRSACWLLKNILTHDTSRLTCIDLFAEKFGGVEKSTPFVAHPDAAFDRNIAASGAASRVTKLKGSSEEILRGLPREAYDFIYIDGSHHAPYVLTDAVLAWHCLKDGGLMGFDDYLWRPELPPPERPQPAIDAFLQVFDGMYESVLNDYQVFIRKTRGLVVRDR